MRYPSLFSEKTQPPHLIFWRKNFESKNIFGRKFLGKFLTFNLFCVLYCMYLCMLKLCIYVFRILFECFALWILLSKNILSVII